MLDWLIMNKEWVFSGIGVLILGAIVRYILKRKSNANITQNQTSGKSSINIQGARDINLSLNPSSEKPDVDK